MATSLKPQLRTVKAQRVISLGQDEAVYKGKIGLLDTPVNIMHPALSKASIEQVDFVRRIPSQHGTISAVALVGQLGEWKGIVPSAKLVCAGAIGCLPGYQASAKAIIKGLKWVANHNVDAIFLPFGHHQPHDGIAKAIELLPTSIRIYASAGNRGSTTPLFPASMSRVIAVGASDSQGLSISARCDIEQVDVYAPDRLWVPGFDMGGWLMGSSASCILAASELN